MENRMLNKALTMSHWLRYFLQFAALRLEEQNGFQIAAALAYTTLLSLVPLLTIMFALPEVFPVSARFGEMIQEFVFNNMVPEVGTSVREYLVEFSLNASQLTLTGLTLLVIIALMLMATIDNALNRIWHVRRLRGPGERFVTYWAMITLGPLLVGVGLVSTSYLLSLPALSEMDSAMLLQKRLLSLLPFLTTTTAFTLLYALVPNCHVRIRHAVWGGVTAAVLFELAKMGFGFYVRSANSEQIYGALAVLPLFLVWIYTSWVIVLFGAHLTFCLAEFQLGKYRTAADGDYSWDFLDAFAVVRALWEAQQSGGGLAPHQFPSLGIALSQQDALEIFACLARGHWAEETANGTWVLSRDPASVTLLDLHRLIPRRLPVASGDEVDDRLKLLEPVMTGYRQDVDKRLSISLEQVLRKAEAGGDAAIIPVLEGEVPPGTSAPVP